MKRPLQLRGGDAVSGEFGPLCPAMRKGETGADQRLLNRPERMTRVVGYGRCAMGKVPKWAQWLMVLAGVLLSPVVVLFGAWFLGWPRIRRRWRHRDVAPGSDRRAGAGPRA